MQLKSFRRKTREVLVGSVGIGGKNPVRIQSMTTSLTHDVEGTTEQIMKLADYGCEIARVTVQGKKEAAACEGIKNLLLKKGYFIPVVADIHFYPPAALEVVEFVDKVRINPGNFLDRRAIFKTIHYDSDLEYQLELDRIREGFTPLVQKCMRLKKALRIGVNHGSLSDRIMSRYGDTPRGMVISALEYAQVAIDQGYYDMIFSMKSSNPLIMIEAYRLLVAEMETRGWDFPLHLGVTEAGPGEDGRIKSAVGIGTLLLDGIGDTIRVSLTEDPWNEIAPARNIVDYFEQHKRIFESKRPTQHKTSDPGFPEIIHIAAISNQDAENPGFFAALGCEIKQGRYVKGLKAPEAVYCLEPITAQEKLHIVKDLGIACYDASDPRILKIDLSEQGPEFWRSIVGTNCEFIVAFADTKTFFLLRELQGFLASKSVRSPLIVAYRYLDTSEKTLIAASMDLGSCLIDKIGQGVMLISERLEQSQALLLNILQACRKRLFKTDYIACPGCGRTLFDLQEVTQQIQAKTAHLAGVKIAVMGCIVNGPGEMADADFGYVGTKSGIIDLYVGKTCVEKNIPSEKACDRLIDLIKSHGKWIEPVSLE